MERKSVEVDPEPTHGESDVSRQKSREGPLLKLQELLLTSLQPPTQELRTEYRTSKFRVSSVNLLYVHVTYKRRGKG